MTFKAGLPPIRPSAESNAVLSFSFRPDITSKSGKSPLVDLRIPLRDEHQGLFGLLAGRGVLGIEDQMGQLGNSLRAGQLAQGLQRRDAHAGIGILGRFQQRGHGIDGMPGDEQFEQLDALGRRGGFHLSAQGRVDALAMQAG